MSVRNRRDRRIVRHRRIRQRVRGTAERPRMAICVTNKHLYVQFVDDDAARTLAAASSLQVGDAAGCNLAGAKQVGERAAQAAREQGIRMVVVDRGGFRYHGRVRQIVESAVAAGLCIARGAAAATEEAT